VKALPPKLRDPFLLAASGDHRYEDIAIMLGAPLGTIKWRIAEARRVVRMKLDRLGHGPQKAQKPQEPRKAQKAQKDER
jgi:DNA-directed RNA polymerase specialized sigma24 family protein